jgi:hypothetical protein
VNLSLIISGPADRSTEKIYPSNFCLVQYKSLARPTVAALLLMIIVAVVWFTVLPPFIKIWDLGPLAEFTGGDAPAATRRAQRIEHGALSGCPWSPNTVCGLIWRDYVISELGPDFSHQLIS